MVWIAGCSHDDVKRLLWLNIDSDMDIVGYLYDDDKKLL
jgi:hypothetical protein